MTNTLIFPQHHLKMTPQEAEDRADEGAKAFKGWPVDMALWVLFYMVEKIVLEYDNPIDAHNSIQIFSKNLKRDSLRLEREIASRNHDARNHESAPH